MTSRDHSFDPELLGAPVTRQEKQEGYTLDVLEPPTVNQQQQQPSSSSRERLAQAQTNGSIGQPPDQAHPEQSTLLPSTDREKASPPDIPQHRLVWYRKTRNRIWLGIAAFVIIAAIVGGVVGGVVGGSSGNGNSNQTSTTSGTSSTAVNPGVQGPTSTTGEGTATATTRNPGAEGALATPTLSIGVPNPQGRRRS